MSNAKQTLQEKLETARLWQEKYACKRRATINDIADIANISKRTVSRIINDSPHVAEKTRVEVKEIIDMLDFRPDPQARGLAFRHSFLIGLIYGNPNPQYVMTLQRGILDSLSHSDYEMVVHPADIASDNYIEKARAFIQRQKLYGVILTPSIAEDEAFISMLREINCSYLRIAPTRLEPGANMIVTYDRQGAESVAHHFSDLGHSRIGFIAGRNGFLSAQERYEGFKAGLESCGLSLPENLVAQGDYTFTSGVKAAESLLAMEQRPTAIFAANDEMAAGALLATRLAGLKTPDDVSIVGFDNFHIAETVWPQLTTVNTPTYDVGKLAAKLLLNKPEKIDETVISVPSLVIRDSSAPLKQS